MNDLIVSTNKPQTRQSRSKDRLFYIRAVWGGSGRKKGGSWASEYGRNFEPLAKPILAQLGFIDVTSLSEMMPCFPFDFIATINGCRVFIDITTRHSARIRTKQKIAKLIGLDLFILHVSPKDPTVYWFNHPGDKNNSIIPFAFFHERGSHLSYHASIKRKSTIPCKICGNSFETMNGTRKRKVCSEKCKRELLSRIALASAVSFKK